MQCSKCNFPLQPEFNVCPKCGSDIKRAAADMDFDAPASEPKPVPKQVDGVSLVNGKAVWTLGANQIARRITEREMAGCDAVKGIVVQDGVTGIVFADGKIIDTIDGGIYYFGPPANSGATRKPGGKAEKQGFFSRLFGRKKQTGTAPGPVQGKTGVLGNLFGGHDKAATQAKQRSSNGAVVTIYLVSNRLFELSFYPIEAKAHDGTPLTLGVGMQLCVTNFEQFRQQYLVDSNEVTITSMRHTLSGWVMNMLSQNLSKMTLTDGSLTADQQTMLKDHLRSALENRIVGMSIVNIFDVATTNIDFERMQMRQYELSLLERKGDLEMREVEFRNRMLDYELRKETDGVLMQQSHELDMARLRVQYEKEIRQLNQDNLISEDLLKKLLREHEMEMRIASVARQADEATRRYESQKILNQMEQQAMLDADQLNSLEERIANGSYERGQLNDAMRHKALVDAAMQKLRLDSELALQSHCAKHQQELAQLNNAAELSDYETILYGKRYSHLLQKTKDDIELFGVQHEADLKRRRLEVDFDDEQYGRQRTRRRDDADLDFDLQKRNREFNFDEKVRDKNFEFDLESRKLNRNFDFEQRRDEHAQTTVERKHKLEMDARRQQFEDLRLKGEIAMRNMQMMMEAKRASKKDDLDAATEHLNIRKSMTAEQMTAEQLSRLDSAAQIRYMDALMEEKSSAHLAQAARREAELTTEMHKQMMVHNQTMHEQNRTDMKDMMAEMMRMQQENQLHAVELARHSMDTSASIAASHAAENASAAERRVADLERDNERYRADTVHAQQRLDANQSQSLDYATRITETNITKEAHKDNIEVDPLGLKDLGTTRLSTTWLRDKGFTGSFNKLAESLVNKGAIISKDYDKAGNPIMLVDDIEHNVIENTLKKFGVTAELDKQ